MGAEGSLRGVQGMQLAALMSVTEFLTVSHRLLPVLKSTVKYEPGVNWY